ncbi:MAG: TetR/AcrR family transcriptional regulator [Bacteroidales bacterium]|jgi:AcrR family transcriptional regulator|nr:TetR/AcrR family transcriptional regulator [Bacteroidales bacterium]
METYNTELLKTVLGLYSKYGIKSVSMDDVSREMGISKKTLYTYVADKNELVEKVIDYQCKERMNWMKSLNLDKLPALEEVVEVSKMINKMIGEFTPSFHYDLSKYYLTIYKKMMKINRESMAQSMLQNLKKGKKEGYYRLEIKEEVIVSMHIANVENLAERGFYNSHDLTPEEIQSELFSYHMHAMLTPKGLEEYTRLLKSENIK